MQNYQVYEDLVNDKVIKRELEPLKLVKDNYKKVVLSMNKSFVKSYDGILMQNIIDFLLE